MEEKDLQRSRVCIALLKGVVFRSSQEELWQCLLSERVAITDYLARIGLVLCLDELDEYAYLRQQETDELPRLIPRYPLSYGLSILLVMLRKKLGEYDTAHGDQRLVVTQEELVDNLKAFLPQVTNEIKFIQDVERHTKKAVELGFLREIPGQASVFEVRPLIRSFVTASWLQEFDDHLEDYLEYGKKTLELHSPGQEGEGHGLI